MSMLHVLQQEFVRRRRNAYEFGVKIYELGNGYEESEPCHGL